MEPKVVVVKKAVDGGKLKTIGIKDEINLTMDKCNKLVQSEKDASQEVKFDQVLFLYVQPSKIGEHVHIRVYDLPRPIQVNFHLHLEDIDKKDEFGPSYKIFYSFDCRRPNS